MDDRITEFALIDYLRSRAGGSDRLRTGIGDDAAITLPGGATATSVDAVVDGIHFRREWCSAGDIAHKAVATALSDLAAMAAEPGEIYVTLGAPPAIGRRYLEALADGLAAAATRFGVVLAGGDTVASPQLFLSVTVVGHAAGPEGFLLRSGASPGEIVAVTGSFGGAAAGLWLLKNGAGAAADGMDEARVNDLIGRQLRPEPRLEAGRLLGLAGARAMIDVSDGLEADLRHLATASRVGIEIDALQVPVQVGVPEVAAEAGLEAPGLVFAGGEDFELAVTLAESDIDRAGEALATVDLALTPIGKVTAGTGVMVRGDAGPIEVPPGHDHLA